MGRFLAVVGFASLLSCQCGTQVGTACKKASDCGAASVCLPISSCAVACTPGGANTCIAGEKCSTAGGCVLANGCGADGDCTGGNLCQLGTCGPKCSADSCGAGKTCSADGHCVRDTSGTGGNAGTGGNGGNSGTGGSSGAGGGDSCGGELFQSTKVQANFLIMLDHSGSMMQGLDGKAPAPVGQSKWAIAVAAVKGVTTKYDTQIRFGLSTFSEPSPRCEAGHNIVPVGDMTAATIASQLPAVADGLGTAISGAILNAGDHPPLKDATRANYVLLLTDGNENCASTSAPVASASQLAKNNIKTFVVGFGGGVNRDVLNRTAVAGGTARNTTPYYYQADDKATLESAFDSIAKGAIGCAFKLAKAPPVPDKVSVYVNGQLIPRDTNKRIGWDFNGTAFDRLTLYGTVCDAVANNPDAKVQIVYGCPGGIIESPGDGGTINLDAGIVIN